MAPTTNTLPILWLDEDYFKAVIKEIDSINDDGDDSGYEVHIAFWSMNPYADMPMWEIGKKKSLKQLIEEKRTVRFKVMIYSPMLLGGKNHPPAQAQTNTPQMPKNSKVWTIIGNVYDKKTTLDEPAYSINEWKKLLGESNPTNLEYRYQGSIWNDISMKSMHQKIVTVLKNNEGVKTAFVGGLNWRENYTDTKEHSNSCASHHDSAVQLYDDAAAAVDREWKKLWDKAEDWSTYLSNACSKSDRRVAPIIGGGGDSVRNVPQYTPTAIKIETTDNSWVKKYTGIGDKLYNLITKAGTGNGDAKIYMENFCVTDMVLVIALANSVRTNEKLRVCIVIDRPPTPTSANAGALLWQIYCAFIMLTVSGASKIEVTEENKQKKICEKEKGYNWFVEENAFIGSNWGRWVGVQNVSHNIWGEKNKVKITSNGDQNKEYTIRDVTRVKQDRVRFYTLVNQFNQEITNSSREVNKHRDRTPLQRSVQETTNKIYCHSKFAVINNVMYCGSANFNTRSMSYDGEIGAFIPYELTGSCIQSSDDGSNFFNINPLEYILHHHMCCHNNNNCVANHWEILMEQTRSVQRPTMGHEGNRNRSHMIPLKLEDFRVGGTGPLPSPPNDSNTDGNAAVKFFLSRVPYCNPTS